MKTLERLEAVLYCPSCGCEPFEIWGVRQEGREAWACQLRLRDGSQPPESEKGHACPDCRSPLRRR